MSERAWVYENNWPHRPLWPLDRKPGEPAFATSSHSGKVSHTLPYGKKGRIVIKYL